MLLLLKRGLGSSAKQLKFCVIGGGPAGFYTAQKLVKLNKGNVLVDIIDRTWAPFGLVRFGVAPDHPEVKNVEKTFTAIAHDPNCRYFGALDVPRELPIEKLRQIYSAIVFAYGCAGERSLDIPGDDNKNVFSAQQIVGWYNGVEAFDLLKPNLSYETAVIIGQGNVGLDIARLLLTPVDVLKKTDITQHALDQLAASKVREVHLVGRRGPLQAAFTTKEFREMLKLSGTSTIIRQDMTDLEKQLKDLARPRRRLTELLMRTAAAKPRKSAAKDRRFFCDFFLQPSSIHSTLRSLSHVQEKGILREWDDGVARTTEETLDIECGLVIKSVGYRGECIDDSIPFDHERGIIRQTLGRVQDSPAMYCAGWIKRGPSGTIATTLTDSHETAESIGEDVKRGVIRPPREEEDVADVLFRRGRRFVTFAEWERCDAAERGYGKLMGKPRQKFTNCNAVLRYLFLGGNAIANR